MTVLIEVVKRHVREDEKSFCFSSRRRHTTCALVTGVQTCALPSSNAISPGPIETEHDDPATTAHIREQKDRIPVGRLGTPEDIAALTAFLCSDAGGFVNGQMIASNGGAQT